MLSNSKKALAFVFAKHLTSVELVAIIKRGAAIFPARSFVSFAAMVKEREPGASPRPDFLF